MGKVFNNYLHSLALRQTYPRLLLTNDKNVALSGSELVVDSVFDVYDIETSIVSLAVGDDANTSHVATTGHHGNGSSIELDVISDFSGG